MNNDFYLQTLDNIDNNDLRTLRLFYGPIIGNNATLLYHHLVDSFNFNNGSINKKYSFSIVSKLLSISIDELSNAREKLEAISLIKSYLDYDNNIIIELKKPLDVNHLAKNELISSLIINNIGRELFEQLVNSKAKYSYSKNNLVDISKKYSEIYDVKSVLNSEIQNLNFDFNITNTHDLCFKLSPLEFIKCMTKKEPITSYIVLVNNLRKSNFSDSAINLIINHSFAINGKLVVNYVLTIAKSYREKNLFEAHQIDTDLAFALASKNANNSSKEEMNNLNNNLEANPNKLLELSGEYSW